ncbi:hypothetical protein GXW82_44410 [Streptacidiphilus sp. 4-A2]|nr:hypothetical protein [Streptacidiphilus sp. 4-A2]
MAKTYSWQIVLIDPKSGHEIQWQGQSTFLHGESEQDRARSVAEFTLSENPIAVAARRGINDYRYQVAFTLIG